ncbi:TerC family protein [Parvibaculum sp.]|uniref:TerC family protein n=1 Tax=Parvibaculum sp. TaxID=2024848 RepID=UPI0035209075
MWAGFIALVISLLALDLGVFHRKQHAIGVSESLKLSAFYICLGLAFGGFVWWWMGPDSGLKYLTGFVIEKSLAVDNLFVIAMIFAHLAIPREYQHRVLFWGILGVIVLRGIMIGLGATLVERFEWILWFFAAFLIYSGFRMLFAGEADQAEEEHAVIGFMRRNFRVTKRLHGDRFFVRRPADREGKTVLFITPLFLALVVIEVADVIFAVDSVPAIFAITTDAYLVYTSNVFAILGLRALYFALAATIERFRYLKHAIALVLMFIGSKIVVADMLDIAKIPPAISLGVTAVLLTGGVAYSMWRTRGEAPFCAEDEGSHPRA